MLAAVLAFEKSLDELGFVRLAVGLFYGVLGQGGLDAPGLKVAKGPHAAETLDFAAGIGKGFGETLVVEEAGFLEPLDDVRDVGVVHGAAIETGSELGGGQGAAAQGAECVFPQLIGCEFSRRFDLHGRRTGRRLTSTAYWSTLRTAGGLGWRQDA